MENPMNVLTVTGLEVISKIAFSDFAVPATGLTLIHTGREHAATSLSMTLAGRMKPRRGTITLTTSNNQAYTSTRHRFQRIALAGVTEIDNLERLVTVRTVIREQAAWHQPWWKPTPRSIDDIPYYTTVAELFGFTMPNTKARTTLVGELDTLSRLMLRIVLAIMSRPTASVLIVDDIDQLRSMVLRKKLLLKLQKYAQTTPVIAMSVNPDYTHLCDHSIIAASSANHVQAVTPR